MTDSIENLLAKLPEEVLSALPEEVLSALKFSVPWQYGSGESTYDPDGFSVASGGTKNYDSYDRIQLQAECWNKFQSNPQLNTAIRGIVGRMVGLGFDISSDISDINNYLIDITHDPRNRLHHFWPKYIGRAFVEGEFFPLLTLHKNGFVEIDFIDPAWISGGGVSSGVPADGIIFHPNKGAMPLIYNIERTDVEGNTLSTEQIPSIFCAYYPELYHVALKHAGVDEKALESSRKPTPASKSLNGFNRFIVAWDKGFLTNRSVGYLRTVIEWVNYLEMLKRWEADWKRSAGAYLHVFEMEDQTAFRTWISLTDEQKRQTGILAKKTPGGNIILPPHIKMKVVNPNLTKITDQDNDIVRMIASGLNETEDVMMGTQGGTASAVKASKGPMTDRIADELAYFERYLKFDLLKAIFFLASKVKSSGVKPTYKVKEAVDFDQNQEPIFKTVTKTPEYFVDVSFPISETIDFEGRARSFLGVKHGNMNENLGLPNSTIASKLGFGGYGRQRLKKATEDKKYPKLIVTMDQETLQETFETEPSLKTKVAREAANEKAKDTSKDQGKEVTEDKGKDKEAEE